MWNCGSQLHSRTESALRVQEKEVYVVKVIRGFELGL